MTPTLRLITTPTGNVGAHLLQHVRGSEHPLRLFVRNPATLPDGAASAAEVVTGDLSDPDVVRKALANVHTAFFCIPFSVDKVSLTDWYHEVGAVFSEALADVPDTRVVFVSSGGAHREGLGPISALGQVEQMLEKAGRHVVHLRAGYFMENHFGALPTIAAENVIYGGFSPDLQIPMVAARDVATVAARWMTDPDWTGHHTAGIHGPADVSMADAARSVSAGLGRPVRYQQVPPEAVAGALQQAMGATPGVAADYQAMVAGLERLGADYRAEPRTAATTTETTLDTFIKTTLKPAFEGFIAQQGAAPAS